MLSSAAVQSAARLALVGSRVTLAGKWVSCVITALLPLAAAPAHAQVAALGKGWLLDGAGSITSAPAEVVSGRNSIKGSYSGSNRFTGILISDPTFIQFAPNQRYTITVSYRIITAGSAGFSFGFFSAKAASAGPFVNTGSINGPSGASGTASLTETLFNFTDYSVGFKINGTGTIAIDEVRIANGNGQLVASENAEGPTIVPDPLNLQITDATTMIPPGDFFLLSAAARDLDGDGYPETILTLTDRNNNSTTPSPIIVIQANGQMRLATSDFFPAGAPTVKNSPMTLFADLNGDGLQDIVFSEAGGDPFGAGRISVALNLGGGKYRDVSDLIPADQQKTRSYAVAVGDVLGDGHVSIVLPDENDGANTALLRWNGNGFDEIRNWIAPTIWQGGFSLHQQSWMNLADFDLDGKQDLLSSGQQNAPNIRIAFGGSGGFSTAAVVIPPDGPWGHFDPGARPPAAQGAEVQPIAVADFNNDGLPDIFAAERKVVEYQPGAFNDTSDPNYANIHANGGTVYSDDSFQVLVNQGSRKFVDVTAPVYVNLGDRTYFSLLPIDINNDGFLDVVGLYQANVARRPYVFKGLFGTTFFLNDGTGRFQPVDGSQIIGATTTPSNGQRWSLGSFVPTVVTPQRTEGIVAETVGGCGGPGFCGLTTLNIYKVVANGSIGTGPNFVDPATLGVPGFNEFYYLNEHPDVAAEVRAGQFRSGLDHYRVAGASLGYEPHAPNGSR